MSYLGDFPLGTTFDFKFTSRRINAGIIEPYTLAGTPSLECWPDNSGTQITAGITLTADFDSVTGLNNVRIVATSGNGYASGVNYAVSIAAGTVNSNTVVGEVVGHFSIDNRITPNIPAYIAPSSVFVDDPGTFRVAFKAKKLKGTTSATGLTIPITISKNGGSFANPAAGATNATEIANGWYYVDLQQGDRDTVGPLIVRGAESTIHDAEIEIEVVRGPEIFSTVVDATPAANSFDGNTSDLSSTDSFYVGIVLAFITGTNKGIARKVESYTGATRTFGFTTNPFPSAPANGDKFVLIGRID